MIYSERIRLRADERTDLPLFVQWLNDPEVRANLLTCLPFSQVEEEQWFENMLKRPAPEHALAIEVRQGDNWKLIGNCSLFDFDWRVRCAEFGIFIGDKDYWNQGYGTEVTHLLLQHGFETLNLNRIFLRVYSTNPRGIRCYEKAGFVHEGRLRQAEYRNGQYVDVLLMGVLRSEYVERAT